MGEKRNGIEVFPFGTDIVRVVRDSKDAPWFVVADVCAALGVRSTPQALQSLGTKKVAAFPLTNSSGPALLTTCVNGSGLLTLINESDKPNAAFFRDWCIDVLLPECSIQKNTKQIKKDTSSMLTFKFQSKPIRVVTDGRGEHWFVAKDICDALGIKDPSMACSKIPDQHKGIQRIGTPGGNQNMLAVNESGLYRLVLRSNKPGAKPFREWVTDTLLPTLGGAKNSQQKEKDIGMIIPFEFESNQVRVVTDEQGEPWFVAKDVAEVLGYSKPENAVSRHCKSPTTTPKQGGGVLNIIPERDVYRLIFRSKLPQAEQFENWVVGEVLPSIRKTGHYQASEKTETQQQPASNMKSISSMSEMADEFCAALRIAEAVGLDKRASALAANMAMKNTTGIDCLALLRKPGFVPEPENLDFQFPPQIEQQLEMPITETTVMAPITETALPLPAETNPQKDFYNATELGLRIGLPVQQFNQLLKEHGFQTPLRNERGRQVWKATDKGEPYAVYLTPRSKRTKIPFLRWRIEILDALPKPFNHAA
ncbi:BRO family protein [Magnetococcales bacterium HHB-1]